MKKPLSIIIPCTLVLGFAAGAAQAQNFGPPSSRETWMNGARAQIWKNGFGECWHSQFGPPPSEAECGPVVAQLAPTPAPVVAPPPPPPKPVVVAAPPPPPPAPVVAPPAPLPPKKDRN